MDNEQKFIREAIVLIKSNERSDFGTGFIIHQDKLAIYVLTCAHVVKQVEGRENIQVAGRDVEVIANGWSYSEDGIDLAVLRITEGWKDKQPLKLWGFAKEQGSFITFGYHELSKNNHQKTKVSGNLGERNSLAVNLGEDEIDIWNLHIQSDHLLQKGYSGSPVLQDNLVIGVVTHTARNQKGAAIPIDTLKKVKFKEGWEGLSSQLFCYSERGVDYTPLNDLLAAGRWKEADKETSKVMLLAVDREKEGWLRELDIDKFPCTDLHTINQLWKQHSKGKFGFSVQKQIYLSMGGTKDYDQGIWASFGERVGWAEVEHRGFLLRSVSVVWYKNLCYNLTVARPGHLPIGHLPGISLPLLRSSSQGLVVVWDDSRGAWCSSFLQRLLDCNI